MNWSALHLIELALACAGLSYAIRTAVIFDAQRDWFLRHYPRPGWQLDVDETPGRTLTKRRAASWQRVLRDGNDDPMFEDDHHEKPIIAGTGQPFVWVSMEGSKPGVLLTCPYCIGFHIALWAVLSRLVAQHLTGVHYLGGWYVEAWWTAMHVGAVWVLSVPAVIAFEGHKPWH